MSKKDVAILERLFSAEIKNELPFQQIGKKTAARLESAGYIQPMEITIFDGYGRFPIAISGWQLTHLGRLTYCMTCTDEEKS